MVMIENPILPGFNPDPAICRVGEDYYIAVSTFEWYPGVRIYHSRNLADWQLVSRPLDREKLLDMRGVPDSCGVWAPCLTHSDGKFWLLYTNTRRFDGNFKDTPNYLTTCETIDGEWDDPVYLNSGGFDPSLFHDDDGRKYVVNMIWDHRPDRSFFRGILCQEYSVEQQKLVGEKKIVFDGTPSDCTEGPHIYKKNGYYYLVTAEGGTGYDHAVTIARSRDIWGPYEVDPEGHPLTAQDNPNAPLQRCGHGSLVETHLGTYYLAHLCSRPIGKLRRSPLGRESAIQEFDYTEDGWFRMKSGGSSPLINVSGLPVEPGLIEEPFYRDNFDDPDLHADYQWLRTPYPEALYSLSERPGFLRLFGKESVGSLYTQAMVARRQTDLAYEAKTCVEVDPQWFQQAAGLICYYNGHKFHYLYVGYEDGIGRYLGIMSCAGDQSLAAEFPIWDHPIVLPGEKPVHLSVRVVGEKLTFHWSWDGDTWHDVGPELDAAILSDEAGKGDGANFTGAFVGMAAQDLTGEDMPADFSYFEYRPL